MTETLFFFNFKENKKKIILNKFFKLRITKKHEQHIISSSIFWSLYSGCKDSCLFSAVSKRFRFQDQAKYKIEMEFYVEFQKCSFLLQCKFFLNCAHYKCYLILCDIGLVKTSKNRILRRYIR
jgi:hypothetical protein